MGCRLCGTELTGRQRIWCSKSCKNRWRKTVPSKELRCLACGKVVLTPPAWHYRRKYCSKPCADSHYNRKHFQGPNNFMVCRYCRKPLSGMRKIWCSQRCRDRWRFEFDRTHFSCPECGRTVRIPIKDSNVQKYCSRSCARAAYNRKHFQGPNNPNWRGGRAHSYGPGWKEIRQHVRERDRVCQRCGKTPEENGRALDVHHKGPHRLTGDNSMRNLVALCRSCHMRAIDHGRKGSVRFAGPQQLVLKPPSHRELSRRRGAALRARREKLKGEAKALRQQGLSLRQIGRRLGVSHQTIANWLS